MTYGPTFGGRASCRRQRWAQFCAPGVCQLTAAARLGVLGNRAGRVLQAEHAHRVGGRAQECNPRLLDTPGELLVLAQEAVTRVDRDSAAVLYCLCAAAIGLSVVVGSSDQYAVGILIRLEARIMGNGMAGGWQRPASGCNWKSWLRLERKRGTTSRRRYAVAQGCHLHHLVNARVVPRPLAQADLRRHDAHVLGRFHAAMNIAHTRMQQQ